MSGRDVMRVTRKGESDHGPVTTSAGIPPAIRTASSPSEIGPKFAEGLPKGGCLCVILRLEYQPLASPPLPHHPQGRLELQVPYATVFLQRRRLRQPVPIDKAFPCIGIHGEIPNLKSGEVLKEMATLRRRDTEIPESGFHDHARP